MGKPINGIVAFENKLWQIPSPIITFQVKHALIMLVSYED